MWTCNSGAKSVTEGLVIPFLMAATLSLTPSIGYYYAAIYSVTGIYINVVYYCFALIIFTLISNGLSIRNIPILGGFVLLMLTMILASMLRNFRGDTGDIVGYSQYISYVIVYFFYSALVFSKLQIAKFARFYLVLMFLWGALLLGSYLIFGPEWLLLQNMWFVELIGHNSDTYYGGTTVFVESGDEFLRPTLPGINSITTVYLYLFAVPISYYSLLSSLSTRGKAFYLLLLVMFVAVVVLTLSRQGILILSLMVVYVGISHRRILPFLVYSAVTLAVILIVIVYFPVAMHRFLQPVYGLLGYQYDHVLSTSDRFESIADSLSIISSNPLGIGYVAYSDFIGHGAPGEHNIVLAAMINNGIIPGALLLAVISYTILKYSRNLAIVNTDPTSKSFYLLNYVMAISILFSPSIALFLIYFGFSNANIHALLSKP